MSFVSLNILKSQPYSFRVVSDPYHNLDSVLSTSVSNAIVWDDEEFLAPIGFHFQIGNESFDSIKIFVDGEITFFQSCGISHFPQGKVLMAFFADLEDRGSFLGNGTTSASPISYVTTGISGNRIFKFEWRNASFFGGAGYDDFVNFQIWLYESGDTLLEIRFGSSNITNPLDLETWGYDVPGPIVNFNFEEDCDTATPPISHLIIGNPNTPDDTIVAGNIEIALSQVTINNVPNNGIVYQFLKQPVGTNDLAVEPELRIYPTPSNGILNFEIFSTKQNEWNIEIFDLFGCLRFHEKNILILNEHKAAISLGLLSSGTYFIRFSSKDNSITKVFIFE